MSIELQYCSANQVGPDKSEWQVLSATTADGGGRGGSSLVDCIKGHAKGNEHFRSLSSEGKKRVQKYQDEAKK